jgi:hypothetical protein
VPETVAELMVTDPVPVEVKVSDCVVAVLTATLPKARLDALTPSVDAAGVNCRPKVLEAPPPLAVSVAVCAVLTAEMVAEKLALVAPEATVAEDGTVTAELLLDKPTANPPLAAAALTVTVHASVPDPVIDELVQENAVSTGTPVPLKATVDEAPPEESLASVSCPVTAPAAEGSNWTVRVAAWPGLKLRGKLAPEIEKPAPVSVAELMVTAAAPVEVTVTVCVAGVLTATLPNATVAVLRLSVGVATFTWRLTFCDTPPAVAVNVTDWEVDTAATFALNVALVAPAATVTEPGTVTTVLLLLKLTAVPPLAAAVLSVTVQESVAGPTIELLAHVNVPSAGAGAAAPVPLRLITALPLVAELLVIVS